MEELQYEIEHKNEKFKLKAKRMKETHIICMEVFIDRLFVNNATTKKILNDRENTKIRVKLADFPCMEIDGTYEEQFAQLDKASTKALRGTIALWEVYSDQEIFLRTNVGSVCEPKTRSSYDSKVSSKDKTSDQWSGKKTVAFAKNDVKDSINEENVKSSDENKEYDDRKSNRDDEKLVKKPLGRRNKERSPKEFCKNWKRSDGNRSDSSINVNVETGIPFNDGKSLIFPFTPQQLLYVLINRPLKLFLYHKIKEAAQLIGATNVSLFNASDIVFHMISIEGGVNTVTKLEGYYPLTNLNPTNNTNDEIGQIKVQVLLSTYGVCASTQLYTLEPPLTNIKFVSDENSDDIDEPISLLIERDVGLRLPLITGVENFCAK